MRHYRFSNDKFVYSRLRRNSMRAAHRMLVWMVFVLTFTVITSVIAMFEFVSSGTAQPFVSSGSVSSELKIAIGNKEQSGLTGLEATGIHD